VWTRWMAKLKTWWKRSRVGFSRFYGQRAIDGARALVGRQKGQPAVHRIVFLVTAVLVVGASLYGWSRWPSRLPLTETQRSVETPETDSIAPLMDWPSPGLVTGSFELVDDSPFAVPAVDEPLPVEDGRVDELATSSVEGDGAGEESADQGAGSSQVASAPRPQPSLPAVSITSMVWPVTGEVAQPYGWYRHPVFGDWRYSSSVVLRPEEDGTVRAALAGRVRDVVDEGGLWRVSIEHAGGWRTEYEGLVEVAVRSYQLVETGETIGRSDPSAGLGLGFAVRQGEMAVNPLQLIGDGALPAVSQ
jgi:Membrane proteins related to metalloendopeptidases